MIVTAIKALKESIDKIINPLETDYAIWSLIIISIAIITKFIYGIYVKKVGKSINSLALIASRSDPFLDGILSFTTLIGAIFVITLNINIERYLGVLIFLFIFKLEYLFLLILLIA